MRQITLITLFLLAFIGCENNITDPGAEYWISPNQLPYLTEKDHENISKIIEIYPEERYTAGEKYIKLNNKDIRFIYNAYYPNHENSRLKVDPEPETTIPANQIIRLTFKSPVKNVVVNGALATGYREHWETKPYPPQDKNHPPDEPIYLIITYTIIGGAQDYPGQTDIVRPYYLTAADTHPPQITHSTIKDGATHISTNTKYITITFDEPIEGQIALTTQLGQQDLNWIQDVEGTTAKLTQLTETDVKRILDETAVTEYEWRGTPLDTPAPDVKGEFVPVKVNTIHGLTPSTPLKPNTTYEVHILIYDGAKNQNITTITFTTSN